jgi:GNAT superfamily N-acetyltransferase
MMTGVSDFAVRIAEQADYEAIAGLRWQWEEEREERDTKPVVTRDEFVERFAAWAREHQSSHHCFIAIRQGEVIGMAWLAIVRRVPTPISLDRASGDLQSVYVIPSERDRGVGGALVRAALESAQERGAGRVTVHSSTRARPAYERAGFSLSPRLLQAEAQAKARVT